MNNLYFTAHSADMDGLACHAMAEMKFEPVHVFVDYPNLIEELGKLTKKPSGDIIVADVGHTGEKGELYNVVKELSQKHSLEAWYDHHEWKLPHPALELFKKYRIEKDMCGAEIVREEFSLTNETSGILAHLAHITDFRKTNDPEYALGMKIQMAINLANFKKLSLERIVSLLAKGRVNDPIIEDMVTAYDIEVKNAKTELDQNIIKKDIKGYAVHFALSSIILYMKEAASHILQKNPEADLAISIFPQGSVITFVNKRNLKTIDIVGFCKSYKGGGRQDGGGFLVKPSELDDRQVLIDKLSQRLKEYIK